MTTETRKGIIAFTVTDRGALYSAYMRFVQNGGVFVPTNRQYELGDQIFLLLQIMDDPTPLALQGQVVWITPTGAQGNKTAGVGVQFDESSADGKKAIEEVLAASIEADRPTRTM